MTYKALQLPGMVKNQQENLFEGKCIQIFPPKPQNNTIQVVNQKREGNNNK